MARKTDPFRTLRRDAHDRAIELMAGGTAGAPVPDVVELALAPDIDRVAAATVPPRGRSFWVSLAGSLAWGVGIVVLLIMFGPVGGGARPWLRPVLIIVVLVWALAFGIVAADHKVRAVRARIAGTARAVVHRSATEAVAHGRSDARWWVQLRVRPGDLTGYVVDGSLSAVSQAVVEPGPVALFVRAPGVFSDDARFAAERFGISLYAMGGPDLVPMSPLASAALKARNPVEVLHDGWNDAVTRRPGKI